MIRLAIAVKGETEEAFVKNVFSEHLMSLNVEPTPFLLGGRVSADRLARQIANLSWSFDVVTSLVDFYGFRYKENLTRPELEKRIDTAVDARINRAWDQSKVFAYVQPHEFEALLFSNVTAFSSIIAGAPTNLVEELHGIQAAFQTPEDIDDSPNTAPSKRILRLFPGYQKVVHGSQLAADIGLPAIRGECPRFHEWLCRLESLGQRNPAPTNH